MRQRHQKKFGVKLETSRNFVCPCSFDRSRTTSSKQSHYKSCSFGRGRVKKIGKLVVSKLDVGVLVLSKLKLKMPVLGMLELELTVLLNSLRV